MFSWPFFSPTAKLMLNCVCICRVENRCSHAINNLFYHGCLFYVNWCEPYTSDFLNDASLSIRSVSASVRVQFEMYIIERPVSFLGICFAMFRDRQGWILQDAGEYTSSASVNIHLTPCQTMLTTFKGHYSCAMEIESKTGGVRKQQMQEKKNKTIKLIFYWNAVLITL